jgi:hypothetical protein
VIRHQLRPPGDLGQLARLVSRLFARPLDRERPLWELHQIDGLERDRSALFGKVHHCMIDGVSGVQLMGVLFDPSPKPAAYPPPPADTKVPALPSSTAQLWRGAVAGVGSLVREGRRSPISCRSPTRRSTSFVAPATRSPRSCGCCSSECRRRRSTAT